MKFIAPASICICATIGLAPPSLSAAVRYSITDLGIENESIANIAINNGGLIAVTTNLPDDNQPNKVFLLDHGQAIELPTLGGRWTHIGDINNSGLLAGSSETRAGLSHAVLYENGGIQDLGTIEPDGIGCCALNDQGVVVGNTREVHNGRAIIVNGPNDFVILGTLGGSFSSAFDINNLGQITGVSFTSDEYLPVPPYLPVEQAFLYENGHMMGIGTLGGQISHGWGINDVGQIVGESSLLNHEMHAFIWDNVNGMRDLGTPGFYSLATHINNQGVIVGEVQSPTESWIAAIFDVTNGYQLLKDLIPANSGWNSIYRATDINDLGQIVGIGVYNGQSRAFLLTPIPEPPSLELLLLGSASIVLLARRTNR
jgi:probable HAF family extracellular repeat protein